MAHKKIEEMPKSPGRTGALPNYAKPKGHSHMHHVLGYDTAGRELFSLDVEAIDEQDAKLIALRELRRTPDGVHKANHAQDLVVLLDWRS
jgi:hypothetical protein